ncbi:MAG: carboxypeptidase regulatory-like domain-containing protein, partial [Gemmatimonadota bacterium]
MRSAIQVIATLTIVVSLLLPTSAWSQTTGQILGRIVDSESREPVVAAEISIEGTSLRSVTSERGDFILVSVPVGEHRLRVVRLGFQTTVLIVRVRPGRTTQLTLSLEAAPLDVEGVTVEVERIRLIEPDVTVSHEVTLGRQLVELPIDDVEQAIELTTGVADGHFRGGRVGQESYLIDGLEIKNQFEASTQGPGLELSPSSLLELEVVTGGFGVDNGSALSGVVSYTTRRG